MGKYGRVVRCARWDAAWVCCSITKFLSGDDGPSRTFLSRCFLLLLDTSRTTTQRHKEDFCSQRTVLASQTHRALFASFRTILNLYWISKSNSSLSITCLGGMFVPRPCIIEGQRLNRARRPIFFASQQ